MRCSVQSPQEASAVCDADLTARLPAEPPSRHPARACQVLSAGVTPKAMALSVAFGITGGLFPVPGLTVMVCFAMTCVMWRGQGCLGVAF